MSLYKSPLVKEAVIDSVAMVQRHWSGCNPSVKKLFTVLGALLVAGGITAGISHFTANGDINVLKQRLVGQVELSTGTYSARSLGELNQLSWDNGLEILAALDALNKSIQTVQALQQHPDAHATEHNRAQSDLKRSLNRVHTLLKDRRVLLETAQRFHSDKLYSPVYHEYLQDTLGKLDALKIQTRQLEKLSQK